jgi:hypothetical protein
MCYSSYEGWLSNEYLYNIPAAAATALGIARCSRLSSPCHNRRCGLSGHTVKKFSDFPVPSRDVTYPNSPCRGIIKLYPTRESLVSDIPTGDGKIVHLFLTVQAVRTFYHSTKRPWCATLIEIDTIEEQQTEKIETEVSDDDRIRAYRCTQHHPGCPSGASPSHYSISYTTPSLPSTSRPLPKVLP